MAKIRSLYKKMKLFSVKRYEHIFPAVTGHPGPPFRPTTDRIPPTDGKEGGQGRKGRRTGADYSRRTGFRQSPHCQWLAPRAAGMSRRSAQPDTGPQHDRAEVKKNIDKHKAVQCAKRNRTGTESSKKMSADRIFAARMPAPIIFLRIFARTNRLHISIL